MRNKYKDFSCLTGKQGTWQYRANDQIPSILHYDSGKIYVCQNHEAGAQSPDLHGFDYSFYFDVSNCFTLQEVYEKIKFKPKTITFKI